MSTSSDDNVHPEVALVRDGTTGRPTLTFQAFTQEDTDLFRRAAVHTFPGMRERRDDDGIEIDAVCAVDSYINMNRLPTMSGVFKDWCETWKGVASFLTEQANSDEPTDDETDNDRNMFVGIIIASVGRLVTDLLTHTEGAWLSEPDDDDPSITACYDLHERLSIIHRAAVLSDGRSQLASHAPFLPLCREVLSSFEALEDNDDKSHISNVFEDIDRLSQINREYTMENIQKFLREGYPAEKQENIESALTFLWDHPDRDWASVRDGLEWLSAICQDPDSEKRPSRAVLDHFKQLTDDSAVLEAVEDWGTFVERVTRMAERNPLVSTWLDNDENGPPVRSNSM